MSKYEKKTPLTAEIDLGLTWLILIRGNNKLKMTERVKQMWKYLVLI